MARARNKDVALAENKLVLTLLVWMKEIQRFWKMSDHTLVLECSATILTQLSTSPGNRRFAHCLRAFPRQHRQSWRCRKGEGWPTSKSPSTNLQSWRSACDNCLVIIQVQANNFSFFQVKHAKAHAQMLRQTISAIKTEVWDPSMKLWNCQAFEIHLLTLQALHFQCWSRFCRPTNISSYPFISNLIVERLWRTILVQPVPVSISIANLAMSEKRL